MQWNSTYIKDRQYTEKKVCTYMCTKPKGDLESP